MSFNTPLSDFEPLTVWSAGAGPLAAYALTLALATNHSATLLPATTHVRAIGAAVFGGITLGWIVQQTPMFEPMMDLFQALMVLGVFDALTGVGFFVLLGVPLISLYGAFKHSKRDTTWFPITLACWVVVGWWIQTCLSLAMSQPGTS